jgi:hypothetical protein
LFEGAQAKAHFVEDDKNVGGRLATLLTPDVSISPAFAEFGYIHRRMSDAEVYFVANTSNQRHSIKAKFRVEGLQAEIWNPLDGSVASAPAEGGSLALVLEPYESRVVVFTRRASGPSRLASSGAVAAPQPIDLSEGWRVTYGQTGRTAQMMARLRSWSEDDETRFFSGSATYERDLDVPEGMLKNGLTLTLDFGEGKAIPSQQMRAGMRAWYEGPVREAAVVYVNERRAGSVWAPPYAVDVTGLLRAGVNKIRVVVANTAINHMAGRRLPDYRLLNLRYGERFTPQDMDKVQPVTSGLLGPIRLVASNGST